MVMRRQVCDRTMRIAAATVAILLWMAPGCRQDVSLPAREALQETIAAVEEGELQRASTIAEAAIRDHPDSHYSWWAVGGVRLHQRHFASAESAFRKGISIEPDEPDLHFGLAMTLEHQGAFEEAIGAYRVVLDRGHRVAAAHARLSVRLLRMDDYDGAIRHAQQAVELEPSSGWAHFVIGYVWAARGDLDRSIDAFTEAARLLPESAETRSHLAEALRRRGRAEDALREARLAIELDGLAQPHATMAIILFGEQRYDEALEHFETALAIDPSHPEAHYNIGPPLVELGRTEQAIVAYRTALEMSPETHRFAAAYTALLKRRGELDEAIAAQQQAVASTPDDTEPVLILAHMLWYADQIEGAASEYRRAVERGRHDYETINSASNALLQTGSASAAVDMLRGMEHESGEDPWVRAELARALIFTGAVREARALLSAASNSEADDGPSVHAARSRSLAWMYLGEWDAAISEAEVARRAYTNRAWSREYEATVLALSGRCREADELFRKAGIMEGKPVVMAIAAHAYVLATLGSTQEAQLILREERMNLSWEYAPLEVQYLTAMAYREIGETDMAAGIFQRCIDRWPKHPWSEEMREMME